MSNSGGQLRTRFHNVFVQVQTAEHKASDRVEGIKRHYRAGPSATVRSGADFAKRPGIIAAKVAE
jgi:hypothetical protein